MSQSDNTRISAGNKGILIIVENLPVPFDRRVWQEATALRAAGYPVSVICPTGKGHDAAYEEIDGIHIYRHPLPIEASGAVGFLIEYSAALFWEFVLSLRVRRRHGFDAIHACNPPDLIFLVGLFHKFLFGRKFLFDHHDISPELFEAKFDRRGVLHWLLGIFEKLTFRAADVGIATNETFRQIAIKRGGMRADRVWVVRSFPDLGRFQRRDPDPRHKKGREHLIGYVGIMARQDGVDNLVRGMAHIVQQQGRSDIQCQIIGDGPELSNLIALADELGVSEYIDFPGYVSGEDLLTRLSTLDVGVIPDPYNSYNDKISMNKVFEYLALGIPTVMYDLEEGRVAAGEAARVASEHSPEGLATVITELTDDPEARRHMSDWGRAHAAENFSWDKEKHALLEAYETLFRDVR